MRGLVWLHRYLGVVVGFLMVLWCLSGFVMMYMPYPNLSGEERLRGLEPLQLDACCYADIPDDVRLAGWRVEMLAGEPVLRLRESKRGHGVLPDGGYYSLRSGQHHDHIDAATASRVVNAYALGHHLGGEPRLLGVIDRDQWTVQGNLNRAPLYHYALDDADGTELYVASSSGEVVQDTNGRQRFWNWLGAVPHWLYPTLLRENGRLWTQVVIWTSVLGCFLTLLGIYLGISYYSPRLAGGGSPYRGLWKWHHLVGLVFGVLTLTWVASGLLSMNPWGLLESNAGYGERRVLAGDMDWGTSRAAIAHAMASLAPDPLRVELRSAPLAGQLYLLARDGNGESQRVDSQANAARLSESELRAALTRIAVPVRAFERLGVPDDYYYPHHDPVKLPVWRVLLDDPQKTRLYLDADSGALLYAVDAPQREFRWLHLGLHRFDFAALRSRPLWDLVVGLLLAGTTALCFTGTWLACRRIARDWRSLRGR